MKIFSFLFFISVLAHCQTNDEITFTILNKFVKDNDSIDLEIKNNSLNNYYLPIMHNNLSEKLSFSYEQYYFFHANVFNKNEEPLRWYSRDVMSDCKELDEYWDTKKESFTINDFIFLKSKESVKIKISFHSIVKVCDYVEWSILEFKETDKKYISIGSPLNLIEELSWFIKPKLRESLELMGIEKGYKLYKKYITSNTVPILAE